MSDMIYRDDAIDLVLTYFIPRSHTGERGEHEEDFVRTIFKALPSAEATCATCAYRVFCTMSDDEGWKACKDYRQSAEADGEDLIIKGAKGIQDGLYNIKDGELFKYKAKGGTVRTYPIVPSAEAVQGEWVRKYDDKVNCYWYECDQCGEYRPRNQFGHEYNANFCPNCGAKMHKGGDDE